jgi:rare lipoprotein A
MPRSLPLAISIGAVGMMLAGCVVPDQPAPPPPAVAQTHGIYKIGDPYQIDGVWYSPAEDWSYDETGIASWYGESFHGKYTANGETFDLNELTAAHRTLPMPCVVEVTNLENGRTLKLRVNDRGPFARGRIIDVSRRAAQLLGFEMPGTAKVRVRIDVPDSIQVASLAGRQIEPGAAPVAAAPAVAVIATPLPPPPGVRAVAPTHVASLPKPPPTTQVALADPPADPPPLPEKVTVEPVKPTQIYIQLGAFAHMDNATRLKARFAQLGAVQIDGARINGMKMFRVRLGPLPSVDEADRLLDRAVGSGVPEARIVVD